jgi:hypothetical protein
VRDANRIAEPTSSDSELAGLLDAVQSADLTEAQRIALIESVLALPDIIDAARRTGIVQHLGPQIGAAIPALSSPRDHVLSIVTVCLEYPQGLASLYAALSFFYTGTIKFEALNSILARVGEEIRRGMARDAVAVCTESTATLREGGHSIGPKSPFDARQHEETRGAMPAGSRYYIERAADQQLRQAIDQGDILILVRGARQVGKTSLFVRGLDQARRRGCRVAHIPIEEMDLEACKTERDFLYQLALLICGELNLPADGVDKIQSAPLPTTWMRKFMVETVLPATANDDSLVLALDEMEKLFGKLWSERVFTMLRGWHERRAIHATEPWNQLSMLLSYSTEPSLFITNPNQSPFNVGTRIIMRDFTVAEVTELNNRYGSPLRNQAEIDGFYALLDGHPYLSRCGLDAMAFSGARLETLAADTERAEGIFSEHLGTMLDNLNKEPDLREVVRQRLLGNRTGTDLSLYRLRRSGIMDGETVVDMRLRCKLYEDFLKRHL